MTLDEAIKEFTICAINDRKEQNYWAAERDETSPFCNAECYQLADDAETRAEYNEQLAEWLTELKDLRSKQKPDWTSIDDKLPDKDGIYLCYLQCGAICQAMYDSKVAAEGQFPFGDWVAVYNSETRDFTDSYWEEYDAVTHWMPCPEPPKENTDENKN